MTTPTPLSPAAQAVFDAADGMEPRKYRGKALAAALIAAADQLSYAHGSWVGPSAIINEDDLLSIAAELRQEGQA